MIESLVWIEPRSPGPLANILHIRPGKLKYKVTFTCYLSWIPVFVFSVSLVNIVFRSVLSGLIFFSFIWFSRFIWLSKTNIQSTTNNISLEMKQKIQKKKRPKIWAWWNVWVANWKRKHVNSKKMSTKYFHTTQKQNKKKKRSTRSLFWEILIRLKNAFVIFISLWK